MFPRLFSAVAVEPAAGNSVDDTAYRGSENAFGRPFWLTYASNTSMMVAVSLLFRYADFVKSLGGTEWHLGWICGVGVVGSLVMRLAQGVGIDTYGPRTVWLWSSIGVVVSLLGHMAIGRIDTPAIYMLRILFNTSIAGFFGASITYVAGQAPVARMAEVIGSLGTSGFVGMMLGTSLGDVLLGGLSAERSELNHMFEMAALLAATSFVFSWFATRGSARPVKRRRLPTLWLLRRYHPGAVLLCGVAMGFGLGLPGIFLRPFTSSLGIPGIAIFFWVYAPTAFATRLSSRRFPERYGVRPMILVGMAALVGGILSFLLVQHAWQLVAPAVLMGCAHAFLFPAVLAGGSSAFPGRNRGLGTTLMLAMFDLGNLIGNPTAGGLLRLARLTGLPPYPTMFLVIAGVLVMAAATYAWFSRGARVAEQTVAARSLKLHTPPPEALPAVEVGSNR